MFKKETQMLRKEKVWNWETQNLLYVKSQIRVHMQIDQPNVFTQKVLLHMN